MRIEAVIFDAVGTVLHVREPVAMTYRRYAVRAGIDLPESVFRERVRSAFAEQDALDRVNGWVVSEQREYERWRTIVGRVLGDHPQAGKCFAELFARYAEPDAWNIEPSFPAVCRTLGAQGIRLGIASNFDARLLQIVAEHPDLSAFRAADGFVVVSSLVGSRKPAERFFREVRRRAGCEGSAGLFVGDDVENDFAGARASGLIPLLFDPQLHHPHITPRCESLIEVVRFCRDS